MGKELVRGESDPSASREDPDLAGMLPLSRELEEHGFCSIQVGALMRRDLPCVRESFALESIRSIFLERDLGCLPVINHRDEHSGYVLLGDILRFYLELAEVEDRREPALQSRQGHLYRLGLGFHV